MGPAPARLCDFGVVIVRSRGWVGVGESIDWQLKPNLNQNLGRLCGERVSSPNGRNGCLNSQSRRAATNRTVRWTPRTTFNWGDRVALFGVPRHLQLIPQRPEGLGCRDVVNAGRFANELGLHHMVC